MKAILKYIGSSALYHYEKLITYFQMFCRINGSRQVLIVVVCSFKWNTRYSRQL